MSALKLKLEQSLIWSDCHHGDDSEEFVTCGQTQTLNMETWCGKQDETT